MENNLKAELFKKTGIIVKDCQILSGGWMNKKYVIFDDRDNKYVVKLFSSKKVEKMSNGEFSSDYLDNQIENNLKIENYFDKKITDKAKRFQDELIYLTYQLHTLIDYYYTNNSNINEYCNDDDIKRRLVK